MAFTTEMAGDEARAVCRDGNVSDAIVAAVAEAKGADPLELEPLYDVVDPDALDRLCGPGVEAGPASLELRFSMAECLVVVYGDGEVVVTPPAEDARDSPTERRDD